MSAAVASGFSRVMGPPETAFVPAKQAPESCAILNRFCGKRERKILRVQLHIWLTERKLRARLVPSEMRLLRRHENERCCVRVDSVRRAILRRAELGIRRLL